MILNILAVILGIGAIIGIHEACHMLVSKLFGVRVLKFSLGFGPVLISKKVGDTTYQLSLLPLGGYVLPAGEDPQSNVKNGFFSLPWYKRALIALAGPVANLLLGFVIIFGLLILLNGWPILAGLHRAWQITSDIITLTLQWLWGFVHPSAGVGHVASKAADLSGPIMVSKLLFSSLKEGATQFLFLLSVISLSLGLFNLFPLPILDGGHVLLYSIEGLVRRKLPTKVYVVWNMIGIILLVSLMLFTCFMDISKLVK